MAGRAVLVAGAGVTGRSVAAALLALGARVTVTDAGADRLTGLPDGVELAPGLTTPPEGTDLVVTSPGWRPTSPLLVAAAAAGVEVIGEIELAWRLARRLAEPPVWLAVTGTNGKTTTVGMLESILRAAGEHAVACGNVGLPVVDAVLAGYRVLAVELSSFQLHWQESLRAHAAVVLNVAEDHLDWHGSLDAYAADKGKIYTGAGVRVYNAHDEHSIRLAENASGGRLVGFAPATPPPGAVGQVEDLLVDRAFVADPAHSADELCQVADVRPAGRHNVLNALAAACLARAYGVPAEAVRAGLLAYEPGAHRATPVGEVGGVRYVNDSKATNPHAAAGSLTAHESVVWIAGGQLKGASVDGLVADVAGRLRAVVLLGVDAEVISAALARHAPDVPVHRVAPGDDEPMIAAVRAASAMARPGDAVVLAPAAASLDMFPSYVHRGDSFTAAVAALVGDGPGGS